MASKHNEFKYLSGLHGYHESEAIPNSLPRDQNSPQQVPGNLYAEQISGSAFTAPRHSNLKCWVYRMRPSVMHHPFTPCDLNTSSNHSKKKAFVSYNTEEDSEITPNQLRWSPMKIPDPKSGGDQLNFVQGLFPMCGAGSPAMRNGLSIYVFLANTNMENEAFFNSDGDFLIVPQQGNLLIQTELGRLFLEPTEIAVITRGIKFKVDLPDGLARGYVLEVFNGRFELPDLGPIGANGLAEPRHFLHPTAYVEQDKIDVPFKIYNKYNNRLFVANQDHSPFDVVAWHGNYSPFKYDLKKFNTMNTVSFDHPDPSIYTVLTVKSAIPGTALADFVIFPPRWMVAEHTFRPPYFHRNCMSEFMGLINGNYDAKAEGFAPGGASLHSMMTPHGPDHDTYQKAIHEEMVPKKFESGLAFMFESSLMMSVSRWALEKEETHVHPELQKSYYKVWQGFQKSDLKGL